MSTYAETCSEIARVRLAIVRAYAEAHEALNDARRDRAEGRAPGVRASLKIVAAMRAHVCAARVYLALLLEDARSLESTPSLAA
jgi:hypothetical protein